MDIIHLNEECYILATSALADDRKRVMKEGETFAVFNRFGDVQPLGLGEQGIYHRGTRFLSHLELKMDERPFFLLSSTLTEDSNLLGVDLTNPDICAGEDVSLPRGSLHLFRSKLLSDNGCFERIRIHNYSHKKVNFALNLSFSADYRDIFEVRGQKRVERGTILPPQTGERDIILGYRGLDNVVRQTRIDFSPSPSRLSPGEVTFDITAYPGQEIFYYISYTFLIGQQEGPVIRLSYQEAYEQVEKNVAEFRSITPRLTTSNEQFNDWLNQSYTDLEMLITQTPQGPYPYAGVPWFSVPFGRDGLITALECLWLIPSIARGVLGYLARTQSMEDIPEKDAEPGKIIHEVREGEMVNRDEVVFGHYYGSIDSTLLFIILAAEYFARSGDLEYIVSIWNAIDRALEWIDRYGDQDGDGFIEYERRTPKGLKHQGWKDSVDSIFHADGREAQGPIALCEVQGYAYAAKRGGALLAARLGQRKRAGELLKSASALKKRFEQNFWCQDMGTYALALDGNKNPCRVLASNPGHCLYTGIVPPENAPYLDRLFTSDAFFSKWGIRTVASTEILYNPMSYHNGSVWPHDNAIIAKGLSRYGYRRSALQIMTGLFDASLFMELQRLPELFCGFVRRLGMGPTLYPVACSPQAWVAGAVFMLLESVLGISFNTKKREICFDHPILPPYLESITVEGLLFLGASLDLRLIRRGENDVGIDILNREGKLNVVITK